MKQFLLYFLISVALLFGGRTKSMAQIIPDETFYNVITLPYQNNNLDLSNSTLAPTINTTAGSYPGVGFKVTLTSSGTLTFQASSSTIASNNFAFIVSPNVNLSSNKYLRPGNGTTGNLDAGTYYICFFTNNVYGIFSLSITSTSSSVAPTATTNSATSVTSTVATLNGSINANNASTIVTFEYGLTTGYGTTVTADQSPVTGSSATSVSKAITGLTPNTTYHYRVKGVNAGGTTNGLDQTFTTSAATPTIVSFSPTSACPGSTVTITGTNFTGATAVSFGGTAATSFSVVNSTSITAVVANGTSGSASVTTAGGTGTKTGFTLNPSIPGTITFNSAIGSQTMVSDGQAGSTDYCGITLNVYGANSSLTALTNAMTYEAGIYAGANGVAANYASSGGSDYIIIKSSDNSIDFSLQSLNLIDYGGTIVKIEGFNNGNTTGSINYNTNTTPWYFTLNQSGALTPSKFQNVDEVRISAEAGGLIYIAVNNIQLSDPVTAPVISSVSVPSNSTYRAGQNLNFTVNYSEAITVNTGGGTPYIPITLNTGGTVNASYVSGTGTTALVFRYAVGSGNLDADGVSVGTTITANGGTLKNAGATDANLTLNSVGSTTGVLVDAVAPSVSSVSSTTANGTYKSGDVIAITISFSEAVTVTGTPTLTLNSGGTASYSSDSGSTILTFSYTVGSGQSSTDLDYSNAFGSLQLSGGTILDAAGNATWLNLPTVGGANSLGGQKNIVIDGVAPIVGIVFTDAALKVGETSLVTFTFSEAVTGFTNADLTIANGTLTTVSSSDGGITWTATFTPTASITDATNVITLDKTGVTDATGNAGSGTTDSGNYTIDTFRPTATVLVADNALRIGETSLVTVTFSEAVAGFTNADLTIVNGTLTAVSSSDGGVTWTATFTPTASITDATNVITLDNTGVADLAGNAGSGTTDSNNYAIDTARPTATVLVADNALRIGETSLVTVTFSEAVTGFTNADLTISNGTLTAVSSSDGGVTWTATFTPTASVEDANNVITIDNTGVADAAGNAGSGTTNSGNYAIDTLNPTVSNVSSTTSNGTYKLNDVITITVTFSEAVSVTGTPTLSLNSGGTATYTSGSGTTVLTYNYTVGAGESSSNLDYSATNSLTLSGGTIKDAADNDATLTLPTVGGASSLGGQKDILIAINPTSGGTIAANQAGCYPFNPAEITSSVLPTGHTGTLEYKWQSSTTSSSTGFSDIAGSNAATYDPGSITVDTWFKRLSRVDCMSDWTGVAESNVVKMTVLPIFSAGAIASTGEEICLNGNPGQIGSSDDGSSSCASGSGDLPELMYFKFNSIGNQENSASSPVGSNPATLSGLTIGNTGESGTALVGNGLSSSSNRLNTGWTLSLPSSGWTISFWLNNFPQTSATTYYYFGETSSSFRCFTGGVAGNGNLIVRGTGLSDVLISSIPSSPTVIHIVHTGSSIKTYLNGVLSGTVAQSNAGISGSGPFTIGGYSSSNSMSSGVLMDEFRMYNRALDGTEIANTWNSEIGGASIVSYQWQKSTTDAISGYSDIVGANSSTYDPPAGLTSTSWYRRQVKDDCCNTSYSNSNGIWKVTVNNPIAPTAGSNSYIYDGTAKTATASVEAGETVDWYANATGSTTSSAPSGTNVGTYSAYAEARNTTTGCVSASRTLITLEITKAMLTVSADTKTKIYGDANPTLTFQYSGWKNSESDVVLDTKPSASTAVNLLTNVGTHVNAISVAGGVDNNYDFTYVPANFTVNKAPLTVTADAKTKVYADANPTLTFQYSGLKNSETETVLDTKPAASTTVTNTTNVGTHTNAITVSGGVDNNYAFSYVAANFTVTQATLTATADAKTKVYGDANPTLTFVYSGWKNSDTETVLDTKPAASTTVDLLTNVGTHTNAITVSGGVDNNYAFSYVPANFTVTQATLTATADAKTKVYGDDNPTLTFIYSGWKNTDTETVLDTKPAASTTVTNTTNVGTHTNAITVSGGVDNNYAFSYVAANFTVTQATLTTTADAKTKVYGDANPTLTFVYSGWKNSDTEAVLDTKPAASTTVTNTTNVGTHTNAITVSGGVDNNYAFSYVAANFTVTKATLTATADAKTKVYGDANPTLTFQYSGWKNTDGESVLDAKPTASTTVDLLTNVGTHTNAITVSGGVDNNYTFSYVAANFEVTKAMLTVTADAKTKVYGDSNPTLTFQYSGWQNAEDETVLTTQPAAGTTVTLLTGAGTHVGAITLLGGVDENYDFNYVPADFVITKAPLTIIAEGRIKHYDQPLPALTFKYSGWKNNDDVSSLTTVPTMSTTVTISTPVGKYPGSIIGSAGVAANYYFIYVSADFEVIKSNQSITFRVLPSKTYGDSDFDLIASTNTGLKVSFTSSNPSVAVVSGNTVKVLGAGTTIITAIQEGTNNFNAAPSVSQTLVVTRKVLTVENATALSKEYDGSAFATIQGATLLGVINSDEVFLTNATSGIFSQATSGTGIQVSTEMTLSGEKAGNYELTQPSGLTADILKRGITVTAMNETKVCSENDPLLTYKYEPELIGLDSFSGALSREVGNSVGTYAIQQGSLALNSNYNLIFQGADFIITDSSPVWITAPLALNRTLEYTDAAGLVAAQSLVPEAFDACDNVLSAPVKKSGEYVNVAECNHVGSYVNTWTVTDASGNISNTYTQVITLVDRLVPTVQELPSIVMTVAPGVCETKINYPEIRVFDDCISKTELKSGLGKEGLFPVGTTMETWEVTDQSGNTATVYFAVTVKSYNQAPVIDQIEDLSVAKYTKEVEVPLSGIDPTSGCSLQEIVSVTAEADDKLLITEVLVDYQKGETTGKLILTIGDKAEGETMIRVTVKDNGGIENGGSDTKIVTFMLKVDRPTGLTDLSQNLGAEVYPNPSEGKVNILVSGSSSSTVRIVSVAGVEVYRNTQVTDSILNLDLSESLAGIYFVEISDGKSTIVKKLILKD